MAVAVVVVVAVVVAVADPSPRSWGRLQNTNRRWANKQEASVAAKGRATKGRDDGKRGEFGLTISIVKRPRGRAHLVFDDVDRVGTGRPVQWSTNSFFTSVDFALAELIDVELENEDFVTIGLAVAARLAAQYKARKPSSNPSKLLVGRRRPARP